MKVSEKSSKSTVDQSNCRGDGGCEVVVVVVDELAVVVAVAARHLQRAAEVLHHPLDVHGERRRRRVHAAVHLLLLHRLAPVVGQGVVRACGWWQ